MACKHRFQLNLLLTLNDCMMKISIRIFILMSSPIEILAVIALESNNLLDTGHVVSANPTKLRSFSYLFASKVAKGH